MKILFFLMYLVFICIFLYSCTLQALKSSFKVRSRSTWKWIESIDFSVTTCMAVYMFDFLHQSTLQYATLLHGEWKENLIEWKRTRDSWVATKWSSSHRIASHRAVISCHRQNKLWNTWGEWWLQRYPAMQIWVWMNLYCLFLTRKGQFN